MQPNAAEREGTLFRAILTILHTTMRKIYMEAVSLYSRAELDVGKGHRNLWMKLLLQSSTTQ
jgi:hypothetical protein